MRIVLPALMLVIAAGGCSHVKEFAPIRFNPIYPRVPNQQRLVAQSTLQAVEKAASGINLAQYAGKKVRVEVNGVFPHTEEDLLNYVAAAVEGEAARAGARVLERPDWRFAADHVVLSLNSGPPEGTNAASTAYAPFPPQTSTSVLAPPVNAAEEKPDIRLVASVDWGGIDLKDHKYVKGGTLAGMILLGITVVGLIPVAIWNAVSDVYGHTFTMIGRVRVTLRAIPLTPGLAAAAATGEGESSVVVDPESDIGYSLIMPLPREAGDAYQRRAE